MVTVVRARAAKWIEIQATATRPKHIKEAVQALKASSVEFLQDGGARVLDASFTMGP